MGARTVALVFAAALLRAGETEIARAFDHFYNLEFDQAISIFEREAAARPDVAAVHNHLAQAILFREMLKAGALESELVSGGNAFLRREKMNPSPEDQGRFGRAIAQGLRLAQAALAARPSDTQALYDLGVSHGLRANYNFLVRKAWMDALRDATQARRAHQRALEIDPGFVDARMVPGTHEYVVASLPWHYRFVGFLTGLRANRDAGVAALKLVAEKGVRNRDDAAILLAVIYRRERKFAEAIGLLNELIPKYPRNYLLRFELAQMHSDNGDGEAALAAIAEVEKLKKAATPGFANLPYEKILYYRATVQFWYRDYSAAASNFERVAARAEVIDPHSGVTAWMRLGQIHDLRGDRERARRYYRKAIEFAPESWTARECEGYLRKPFRRTDDPA
jgi:tetratricopeptide (TPR) repeat protein